MKQINKKLENNLIVLKDLSGDRIIIQAKFYCAIKFEDYGLVVENIDKYYSLNLQVIGHFNTIV